MGDIDSGGGYVHLGSPGPYYRCQHCNDVFRSENRWNMVTCHCGKSAVDGGDSYTKSSFTDLPPVPAEPEDFDKKYGEYYDWEDLNEPRRSKSAKPKHAVDNRSIFTIAKKMVSRYGKKKK